VRLLTPPMFDAPEGNGTTFARRRANVVPCADVPVVVVDEDPKNPLQMPAVPDQRPVEALSAHRADEALGDRVGLRRFDGSPDDLDALGAENLVERAAELDIVVA
jgi:hypothetical protein